MPLNRLTEREHKLFDALYPEIESLVTGIVAGGLGYKAGPGSQHSAALEDICQNVFVDVARSERIYEIVENAGNPNNWREEVRRITSAIASRRLAKYWDKTYKREEVLKSYSAGRHQHRRGRGAPKPVYSATAPIARNPAEEGQFEELVSRVMAKLPESYQKLLAMRLDPDRIPKKEIANRLGITGGALRVRLFRLREMLMRFLRSGWSSRRCS